MSPAAVMPQVLGLVRTGDHHWSSCFRKSHDTWPYLDMHSMAILLYALCMYPRASVVSPSRGVEVVLYLLPNVTGLTLVQHLSYF